VNKIEIKSFDNLNIKATGTLKMTSGNGWINVGSQDDITIDNSTNAGVKSGTSGNQELRLKTDGSIYASNYNNIAIYAKNAVLEAASGTIGIKSLENNTTTISPLIVNLTGGNADTGWITARAEDGVYITFVTSNTTTQTDAYIREISSQGDINLEAASFVDALPSNSAAKIGGVVIDLKATNGSIGNVIGDSINWLLISQKDNGSTKLSATDSIYVKNPSGSLNLESLTAYEVVQIKALIDLIISGKIEVQAETTLTTTTGDLEISGGSFNIGTNPFTATAGNDILISDSTINAGTTILTATNDLLFNGGTTELASAELKGNNISITGSTQFKVTNAFTATANNDLSIENVATTAGETKLTATTGDLKISGGSFNIETNSFTATAQNDLSIEDVESLIADTTTLTATTGDLIMKNSELTINDKAQLEATSGYLETNNLSLTADYIKAISKGNISLTGGNIHAKGESADSDENALVLQSQDANILLGGLITVDKNNVKITADKGEIFDNNDTDTDGAVNLKASESHIVLSAKNGIGSTNVLEFASAKSIEAKTETGNIVLDISSDTILKDITTNDGNIDIYSNGSLTIAQEGKITAEGTNTKIILGAGNDVYFGKNSSLEADKDIMIVAAEGDIVSQATENSESVTLKVKEFSETAKSGIYLVAGKNITGKSINADSLGKFIGSLEGGKVDVIAGNDISVHNLNASSFILGNVFSGGDVLLTSVNDKMGIDRIVAQRIDLASDNINIQQLADNVQIILNKFVESDYNTSNQKLLGKTINLKLNGEISLAITKEGATITIPEQQISTGNTFKITVDNLVIDHIIAETNSGLSHLGYSGNQKADSTTINQISSNGDFTINQLYSDQVLVHSDNIAGDLIINDGQFGNTVANARLEINQVETEIDAINKSKTVANDFWVWSLDGTYSLVSSHGGIAYNDDSLRALRRTQMYLTLNGDTSYTDTAFGELINDLSRQLQHNYIQNTQNNNEIININGIELPLPSFWENQENTNNIFNGIEDIWSFNWTNNTPNTENLIISPLENSISDSENEED
jgi:hypothetical protein